MLSPEEKQQILYDFPNIKLSYENITHKKVYSDFVLAVPDGKKYFAWFTVINKLNICYILELRENKQILDIQIVNCCFDTSLSYGTIFYGTIFNQLNNSFFAIEDIFLYKGKDVSKHLWIQKLELFKIIMNNDIKQIAYNKSFVVFGLPIIKNNLDDLIKEIDKITYKISCIQFRNYNNKNVSQYFEYKNIKNINIDISSSSSNKSVGLHLEIKKPTSFNQSKQITKREIVFQVSPDIQNDIYYLYCYDNDNALIYYNIAYIPNFKSSVFMNKLFRNIKENDNLDALEESDDELDFENEKEDRYVYLDRKFNMVCSYNSKFKKWAPIRLADENMQIINLSQL
jgi:hypothetical protein